MASTRLDKRAMVENNFKRIQEDVALTDQQLHLASPHYAAMLRLYHEALDDLNQLKKEDAPLLGDAFYDMVCAFELKLQQKCHCISEKRLLSDAQQKKDKIHSSHKDRGS